MSRLRDRIPREKFESIFRPMVREFGTRTVVLRLNESARTAIPRQTKLSQFMPKLDLLIYERERPKADAELERLWNIYFEGRLEGEAQEEFDKHSEALNENLDQDKIPEDPDKQQAIKAAMDGIESVLSEAEFGPDEIEAVFRIKAFPEVLAFYLEHKNQTAQADA